MKDFTTMNYIAPAIEEINQKYEIKKDDLIKAYFHCDLILHKKGEYPTTIYVLRYDSDFYIPGIHAIKELISQLSDYCLSVQTYLGELDRYMFNVMV